MNVVRTLHTAGGIAGLCGGLCVVFGIMGLKYYFGYPDIIRAEPGVILQRIHELRHIVPFLYYFGVGGAGISMFFFSISFGMLMEYSGERVYSKFGQCCGIVAGVLLFTGIIRYSILFPSLGQLRAAGQFDAADIDLVFKAMNTYVGESIAEHAQFLFSSMMFLFFGISILKTKVLPKWIALFAIATTVVILIGNLEQFGCKFAFFFNRTAAKMLALWLLATGMVLLWKRFKAGAKLAGNFLDRTCDKSL